MTLGPLVQSGDKAMRMGKSPSVLSTWSEKPWGLLKVEGKPRAWGSSWGQGTEAEGVWGITQAGA